jgi:hypothetical protein
MAASLAARSDRDQHVITLILGVFVESSGRFWSLMREKAVHCLGILHYGWAWNLASKMDDTGSEAKPTALGYVFVFWISTGTNSARDFR